MSQDPYREKNTCISWYFGLLLMPLPERQWRRLFRHHCSGERWVDWVQDCCVWIFWVVCCGWSGIIKLPLFGGHVTCMVNRPSQKEINLPTLPFSGAILVSARVSYLKRWYIMRSTPINREVSQSQTIWNLQLPIVTRALKNPASEKPRIGRIYPPGASTLNYVNSQCFREMI